MATILVLGAMRDPHVAWVVQELHERSELHVIVLDYLSDTTFAFNMDASGKLDLLVNGVNLPSKYIVWDCVKILPGTSLYLLGDQEYTGYAAVEWRAFYKLICATNGDNVVNSLLSRLCMVKPYQQMVAATVGLKVAPTLVTNSQDEARRYAANNSNELIMKSLSSAKFQPASEGEPIYRNVMTMRVTEEDLNGATIEEIRCCPHFLQKKIGKAFELRVVYVDGAIFAFKIDSQKYKTTEVDWRYGIGALEYTPFELDTDVSYRISCFMKAMGLFSGSLDLIVDKEGQYWFLECNQQGAWGWLDELANGVIRRAFAAALAVRAVGSDA